MARLLVNPDCPVYFGAFRSSTRELGASGWDIAVENDHFNDSRRMLLYHHGYQIKLLASCKNYHGWRGPDPFYDFRIGDYSGPEFFVNVVTPDLRIRTYGYAKPMFNAWSDTYPRFIEVDPHEYSIDSLPFFIERVKESPKQEIIVAPQDVYSLLEQIKQMQAPEQARIRARERSIQPIQHATILAFPEAA